jgi:hypothetical protein
MKRFVCLGVVLCLSVFWLGCGDVFRPIIIPNPPIFPSPAAAHTVVTISDNGTTTNGSAMVIDVSGDSVVSTKNVGLRPMHAAQQSATSVLVANQSVTDVPADTITKLTYSGTTIASTTTITLPPSYDPAGSGALTSAAPNFVASMEANQGYVLLPNYQAVSTGGPITPSVDVFSTQSNSSTPTPFPVGVNPVAMVETPDGKKLYVANQGNSTSGTSSITAFNTGTLSLFPRQICNASGTVCPPSMSSGPIWLAARSDSQQVYALESNGTLAYLNTSTTGGPDIFTETSIVVPGTATYMWYDMILNRLYIPSGSQLTIVDVSQSAPAQMATVAVPPFSVAPTGSATVPATAIAATSTPDGTRAYVASVPSTPDMVLPTQATITSVVGDGTNATYTYSLTSGYNVTPGVTLTISGLIPSGGSELTAFEGTLQVSNVIGGTITCPTTCFQILNSNTLAATTVTGSATGSNIFPQVTLVNTNTNTATPTPIAIPGFAPYDVFCSPTVNTQAPRFRFMMAAGGDSSRVYLSSCDAGNVNIVDTISESYIENTPTANSQRPPIPPSQQNAPQNPTFMIAGP